MSSIWILLLVVAGLILFVQFLRRPRGGGYYPRDAAGPRSDTADAHAEHGATSGPERDEHAGGHRHRGC